MNGEDASEGESPPSKYGGKSSKPRRLTYSDVLLMDDELRRGYNNLRRGSVITADAYLHAGLPSGSL